MPGILYLLVLGANPTNSRRTQTSWRRANLTLTAKLDPVSAPAIFDRWLTQFRDALESLDVHRVGQQFVADGYWKDMLSFTWSFPTYHGREEIERCWARTQDEVLPSAVRYSPNRASPRAERRSGRHVVEGFFDFDTKLGRGTAFVRLLPDDEGNWSQPRAWILLTTLQELHGSEETVGSRRPMPHPDPFGGDNLPDEWQADPAEYAESSPEVLIVGGGQAGLALAARLGKMGVDCLIIEKNARIGDNWRHRYRSLILHNETSANHMPYLPFPETWPAFLPKNKLADWLEAYAEFLELNVWTETVMTGGRFDDVANTWRVDLTRGGEHCELEVPHLVLATGSVSGVPNIPALPGLDSFAGEIIHSSQFKSGLPYQGKRAIVIGTGNSAHDIAQELYCTHAERVTMVQRSPTCVVSLTPSAAMIYGIYSEERSADDTDLVMAALPYPLFIESMRWITTKTCELDKELLTNLQKAGFETDFEPDGTGFYMRYFRRGGGYYINVGCSELIADRKIDLVQARDLVNWISRGLLLRDGNTIDADLVVLATGYENQQEGIRRLFGNEVANRVGHIWGFDENYMMRNMWQRTAQQGLWLMGGSLLDCRFYSRLLALQIIAELRCSTPATA